MVYEPSGARTPALLVPATPIGRFYNALPELCRRMAQAVGNKIESTAINKNLFESDANAFNDSVAHLEQLLWTHIGQFSFDDVSAIGANDFLSYCKALPIFPWDEAIASLDVELWAFGKYSSIKTPVQPLSNGLYRFAPTLGYALLSRQKNRIGEWTYIGDYDAPTQAYYDPALGVCFSRDVAYCLVGDPLYVYNGRELTWNPNPVQNFVGGIAFGFNDYLKYQKNWYTLTVVAPFNTSQIVPAGRGSYKIRDHVLPDPSDPKAYPWCTNFLNWPGFLLDAFANIGRRWDEYDSKVQRGQWLQFAFAALAVYGVGSAIASISASGASVSNIAQLVSSVDNLPDVDLGVAGDIAKATKTGLSVDDFYDFEMPDVDPGSFGDQADTFFGVPDIDIAPFDIGAVVDEFTLIELGDLGIDTESLGIDITGAVYDDLGELVNPSIEVYAQSLYIGDDGGVYDFANRELLSPQQAAAAFDEGGIDELTARTWAAASKGGNTFVAETPNAARPATTPAARSTGVLPTFSGDGYAAFLLNAASTIGNFVLAREQIQRTGRYTPPGATSPYGTANPTRVGVPQAQPDGSVIVKNADGSVTRTNIDGSQQVIRPGQQAGMLGGISSNTLLLGGAALAAILLLRR